MVGVKSEDLENEVDYDEVLEFCVNTGFLDVVVGLDSMANVDLILRQIKVKTIQSGEEEEEREEG